MSPSRCLDRVLHYTQEPVTTLHDFGGDLGTAFGHHFLLGSHNVMVTALGPYCSRLLNKGTKQGEISKEPSSRVCCLLIELVSRQKVFLIFFNCVFIIFLLASMEWTPRVFFNDWILASVMKLVMRKTFSLSRYS